MCFIQQIGYGFLSSKMIPIISRKNEILFSTGKRRAEFLQLIVSIVIPVIFIEGEKMGLKFEKRHKMGSH
jgi:hypothetical protein